jgi:hypothetical protein
MGRTLFFAGLALLVAGCGGLKTAPVSGVIKKDGQPLADVSVSFTPQTASGEAPASNGRTDATGRYSLSVTATGKSGAIIGKHTVRIAFIGSGKPPDSDVIDPNFVDPIPPHDLTFEVKPGKNEANFDLKSQ